MYHFLRVIFLLIIIIIIIIIIIVIIIIIIIINIIITVLSFEVFLFVYGRYKGVLAFRKPLAPNYHPEYY